jgi:9-cis-beta-carotene 9',10'-cleaving dioxygenase
VAPRTPPTPSHPMQVSIDLDKRGTRRGCAVRRLSDQWTRPADFPAINPGFANRRSRFVYAGAASGSRRFLPYFPFDSVVKVDVSDGSARLWSVAGRKFVGEPVFVPTGSGEDDGYVLLVEVRGTNIHSSSRTGMDIHSFI